MASERRVRRDEFETVSAAVRNALASGRSIERIEFGDTELVFDRTSEGDLTLSAPGTAAPMPMFVDPAGRPDPYPQELPFVAGEVITIDVSEAQLTALWWGPEDPAQVFEEVHQQSVASGWTLEGKRDHPEESAAQRVFAKGARMRFVSMSEGAVTLLDRDRPPNPTAGASWRR